MDSINREQPEENFKNLHGTEATTKMKQLVKSAGSCFFCTNIKTGQAFATRPMSIQQIDDDGNIWFLSSKDSNKNSQIAENDNVQLLFQGSEHSDFLNLYGKATINYDKDKIKELWTPILKTWFTDGLNDSRISVIKIIPVEGYYWDNKHGNIVAFAKMLVGAVIGKTLDDSIEGNLIK